MKKPPKNTRDYGKVAHFQSGGVVEHAYQRGVRKSPWYREFESEEGGPPKLNDPDYNYRKAWRSGMRPKRDENDKRYHWPSRFKGENHPNRFVNGVDTITDHDD
jgi:hypothetical protein